MKYTADEHIKPVKMLEPLSRTAAATATPVKVTGFSEALIVLDAGTVGADASVVVGVIEGPTLTACTGVISGASFDAITTSTDQKLYVARLDLNKRDKYLNIKSAVANATAGVYAVQIVLSNAKTLPVTQSNTVVFSL